MSLGPWAVDLAAPFLLGLMSSAHCVAMCGGIVGSLCGATDPTLADGGASRERGRRLAFLAAYNGGRVSSYFGAGALAGALGAMAQGLFPANGVRWVLGLVASAVMVGGGLFLADLWPRFSRLEVVGKPLWSMLQPWVRRVLPVRTLAEASLLGALWGWLPCGLVYVALTVAMGTGGPLQGGLAMAAFGFGTMPALMAVGWMVEKAGLAHPWRTNLRHVAGWALVAMGCVRVLGSWTHAGHPMAHGTAPPSSESSFCIHPAGGSFAPGSGPVP